MLIGETELSVHTGSRKKDEQIKWLSERNIVNLVDDKGRIIVHRQVFDNVVNDTSHNSQHANIERGKKKHQIELSEILDARILSPKSYGIYFLIKNGKVIYIGQSNNVLYRVGTHAKTIDFDHFSYIPCSEEDINAIESRLIKKFHPELNVLCRTVEL